MRRIFIAADLPPDMREKMAALKRDIKGVRWYGPDHIHLTMRFIGEVEDDIVGEVQQALYSIEAPAIELESDGVGLFFAKKRPRVIWVGLQPAEPLKELRSRIDEALQHIGLPEDKKAFKPHVTIGKCKKSVDKGSVLDLKDDYGDWKEAAGKLSTLTLYSSTLSPEGAIHTPLEHYPLNG